MKINTTTFTSIQQTFVWFLRHHNFSPLMTLQTLRLTIEGCNGPWEVKSTQFRCGKILYQFNNFNNHNGYRFYSFELEQTSEGFKFLNNDPNILLELDRFRVDYHNENGLFMIWIHCMDDLSFWVHIKSY